MSPSCIMLQSMNFQIISTQELPPTHDLSTYFLHFAAFVWMQLMDCDTIWQVVQKIVASVLQQYNMVFILYDTCLSKSIKRGERKLCDDSKRYVLKSPGKKLPFVSSTLKWTKQGNAIQFDQMEMEEMHKLCTRLVYSPTRITKKIITDGCNVTEKLKSDHEQAGTKLVAVAMYIKFHLEAVSW